MGVEIERKFLVNVPELLRIHYPLPPGDVYEQGYLSEDPTVRVRQINNSDSMSGFLTVKGKGLAERKEFEYRIPPEDTKEILELCRFRISKIRRHFVALGHDWEVDEFLGAHQGLWLAEVELSSVSEHVDLPSWIGAEVTQDRRFQNVSLAKDPNPFW